VFLYPIKEIAIEIESIKLSPNIELIKVLEAFFN